MKEKNHKVRKYFELNTIEYQISHYEDFWDLAKSVSGKHMTL